MFTIYSANNNSKKKNLWQDEFDKMNRQAEDEKIINIFRFFVGWFLLFLLMMVDLVNSV